MNPAVDDNDVLPPVAKKQKTKTLTKQKQGKEVIDSKERKLRGKCDRDSDDASKDSNATIPLPCSDNKLTTPPTTGNGSCNNSCSCSDSGEYMCKTHKSKLEEFLVSRGYGIPGVYYDGHLPDTTPEVSVKDTSSTQSDDESKDNTQPNKTDEEAKPPAKRRL